MKTGKVSPNDWVMLQGAPNRTRHSSDMDHVFRQESYFHWAFGVLEPDFFGACRISDAKSVLFTPRLDEDYATWMGSIPTAETMRLKYAVDECYYADEIASVMESFGADRLLCLYGMNTDSGLMTTQAIFDGISKFTVDTDILHDVMAECRVFKSLQEQEIIRYTNEVSSKAHIEVMKRIRPGMKEYQLEALFEYYCYYYGGCRHVSYTNICGSGTNGAILHYGHAGAPNDKTIHDGDICLFDMGGEYYCYTSDITCSFPANGKFTPKQKAIYNIVLNCVRAVFDALKPGVLWSDLHHLSLVVMLEGLKDLGLVKGNVDDMMKANVGAVFLPCGLGHLMGLDVHDVGGYLPGLPERRKEPGFRNLRTCREMKPNMVITIEPGIYFNDYNLNKALANPEQARFLNREAIEEYRGTGGIRIEDDVVVTETGALNLTAVPRDVEEIEALMAEGRKLDVHVPQEEAVAKLQEQAA